MFDGAAIGKQMVDIVRKHVAGALQPVLKRIEAIESLPAPVSVTGAVIDRDGALVLTHSDGSTKNLGVIVGKDGEAKDGADGLGFDDMVAEYDGERGIVLRFIRGDKIKEFAFSMPVVIDRGVWAEGKAEGYAKGDGVTWAGSFWISQKDENGDKPDGGDGWRLAVKRGRDGKSLKVDVIQKPEPVKVA